MNIYFPKVRWSLGNHNWPRMLCYYLFTTNVFFLVVIIKTKLLYLNVCLVYWLIQKQMRNIYCGFVTISRIATASQFLFLGRSCIWYWQVFLGSCNFGSLVFLQAFYFRRMALSLKPARRHQKNSQKAKGPALQQRQQQV